MRLFRYPKTWGLPGQTKIEAGPQYPCDKEKNLDALDPLIKKSYAPAYVPAEKPYERPGDTPEAREIKQFFEKKSNPLPSQRTVSKDGIQKRILSESVSETHKFFLESHPEKKISERSFWRHKPAHVLSNTKAKMLACLCDICENPKLKVRSLKGSNLLRTSIETTGNLLDTSMCVDQRLECLDRICQNCGVEVKRQEMLSELSDHLSDEISYFKWQNVGQERRKNINGQIKNWHLCVRAGAGTFWWSK